VPREPQRKPFDEEEEAAEEVVEQRSSGAGTSNGPSLSEILGNYEAKTSTLVLEEIRKGKAPMRSAARGAPSVVGTDKGKRPRPTVRNLEDLEDDLEKEALACGSGDDEEEDGDEEANFHPRTPPRAPLPHPGAAWLQALAFFQWCVMRDTAGRGSDGDRGGGG
jgi:hypothetical protein